MSLAMDFDLHGEGDLANVSQPKSECADLKRRLQGTKYCVTIKPARPSSSTKPAIRRLAAGGLVRGRPALFSAFKYQQRF